VWAFLVKGQGRISKSYLDYTVMKEMGWSWQELQECPQSVYEGIVRYLNTEAKFSKRESK